MPCKSSALHQSRAPVAIEAPKGATERATWVDEARPWAPTNDVLDGGDTVKRRPARGFGNPCRAGYGWSASFRKGLSERELLWAMGITRRSSGGGVLDLSGPAVAALN